MIIDHLEMTHPKGCGGRRLPCEPGNIGLDQECEGCCGRTSGPLRWTSTTRGLFYNAGCHGETWGRHVNCWTGHHTDLESNVDWSTSEAEYCKGAQPGHDSCSWPALSPVILAHHCTGSAQPMHCNEMTDECWYNQLSCMNKFQRTLLLLRDTSCGNM